MERKLLSFYSDTCGPCQIFKPIVSKIEASHQIPVNRIDVKDINGGAFAGSYGVQKVPTLILLEDEKEVARLTGANTYMRTLSSLGLTDA